MSQIHDISEKTLLSIERQGSCLEDIDDRVSGAEGMLENNVEQMNIALDEPKFGKELLSYVLYVLLALLFFVILIIL